MATLDLKLSGNTAFSSGSQSFVWNETILGANSMGIGEISATATTSGFSVDARTAGNALNIVLSNTTVAAGNGNGNDTIYGGAYADTILTGNGNDNITGGAGDDIISGGAGNDTFNFGIGFGNDLVAGAAGGAADSDTVKFTNYKFADLAWGFSSAGTGNLSVTVNGDSVTFSSSDSASQAGTTFITTDKTFHVFASSTDSALIGTSGADYIRQVGSTGTINGNGGADTLVGGSGDNAFTYGAAVVSYDGGAGIDTVTATAQTTAVTIDLTDAKFTSMEAAVGGSSNDLLKGLTTSDLLEGGAGNDVLWSRGGADRMSGGAGNDSFYFAFGDGNDTIVAGTTTAVDADTVKFVGVNFNQLTFSAGTADLSVKYGDDVVSVSNFSAAAGGAQTTWITNDKTFHVYNNGTDTAAGVVITGTTGADYMFNASNVTGALAGNGGADTLVGGIANDTFVYNVATAKYTGNAGTDVVTASTSSVAVTIDLFNDTLYSGIENAIGGSGNDLLRGSTANETLEGGAGRDAIWSNAGDDRLSGGAGLDTYWFAAGDGNDAVTAATTVADADTFRFKNVKFADMSYVLSDDNLSLTYGGDVLKVSSFSYAGGAQTVNVFEASDKTFHLFMENAGTSTSITGTTGADYIVVGKDTTPYTVDGKGGADTIVAGAGDDIFVFKSDVVSIDGGAGSNKLTASNATAGVDLNLADARFTNIASATGSSYNDILRGTTADNTLVGGSGNDVLWGGAGNDTMTGGAGADTYWFGAGCGTDTINDDSANSLDTVKLYTGTFASQALNAGNLELSMTDGSKLIIANWENASSKLNKFEYAGSTFRLSSDATTWTKI